jgi:hypothetical protein
MTQGYGIIVPPPPARKGPRATTLVIIALAAAVVVLAVSLVLVLVSRQQQSLGGATYTWRCVEVSNGAAGYSPQVTITNTSSQPLPVNDISVAIFSTSGSQVTSVDVSQPGLLTSYIAPGASPTFTDDHGIMDPSWNGLCKVENLS